MQQTPSVQEIQHKVAQAAFGNPLITNVLRGQVVEAIIACALEPLWTWCAQDYSSWDFERADGLRLEVKQSAARQTWATFDRPSTCSFDIAERKGRWEGPVWHNGAGRAAHLYIFAHHPLVDETADHRDPTQWQFYVVATSNLPSTKRLSLSRARQLAQAIGYPDIKTAVQAAADAVTR